MSLDPLTIWDITHTITTTTTTTTTNNNNNNNNNNNKYKTYFMGTLTSHVAQIVNTEQLQ